MSDGLPELARMRELQIKMADLYGRFNLFEPGAINLDREIGVPGKAYISKEEGIRRGVDILLQSARHAQIAFRLSTALTRYEVLYVHSYKELFLATLAIWLHGGRTNLLWHCHGLGYDNPPPMLRWLANRCQKVIAISRSVKERLVEVGVDEERIAVVYNAVKIPPGIEASPELVPNRPPVPGGMVILVATATMNFEKGIHLAIEALESLPDSTVLWITGNDADGANRSYVEALKSIAQRANVSDRVLYLGLRKDIYSVMKAADVVCVPSLCREGFGLVAAEGMALGKVVVVSNRGGLPEVVDQGRKGLIFDPEAPGDLAAKLNMIVRDATRMSAMGAEAAVYAAKTYAYARWAEQIRDELVAAGHADSNRSSR